MFVILGPAYLLLLCVKVESNPVSSEHNPDGVSWSPGKDVNCWYDCGEEGGSCPAVCGQDGWCCRWDFISDNCPDLAREASASGYHSCVHRSQASGLARPITDDVRDSKEHEVIFLVGGSPSDTAGTSSEVLDMSSSSVCASPVQRLPSPRWGHTVNYVKDSIIVCGGGYNSSTQTTCIQAGSTSGQWEQHSSTSGQWEHHSSTTGQWEHHSSTTGQWEHHSSTTGHRWGHSSVLAGGGELHLIGGLDSDAGRSTESFEAGQWKQGSPLPYNIGVGSCSVEVGGGVVVTGGAVSMEKAGKWDVGMDTWSEELPEMPVGRFYHGCATVKRNGKDYLVVAGGHDGFNRVKSSAVMDIRSNAWTVMRDMKEARRGGKMVRVRIEGRDRLFMLGGEDEGRNVLNSVEELVLNADNLEESEWIPASVDMNVGRYGFDAVAVPKQVFCK